MPKILKLVFFFILFSSFYISSQETTEVVEDEFVEELNPFLKKNNSLLLTEMFTINIGIMKFKNVGNLQVIDPLDSESVVNSIKNELEKVKAIKLSRKAAVLKALNVYFNKIGDINNTEEEKENNKNEDHKEEMQFLKRKVFYSKENLEQNSVYEVFLKLRKDDDFGEIAKLWFENIENPFYIKNISEPFERILKSEEDICMMKKANDKGPLDFLFYGEIERIDNIYFVTINVYSALLNKKVEEFSYVADSETLSQKTAIQLRDVLSKIFLINYASLTINTNDEEIRIYLDSDYIGRNNVFIDYLLPGKYVITLKKEKYKNVIENITIMDFEEKKIELTMEEKEELQVVNFYIEPLGTKIFINSVFEARSPFKKALPKGDYVIFAKNDLYENHRYVFTIDDIKEEEKTIIFHLKSKDINNFFKLKKILYYTTFWNFTFSLIVTVPLIVFAVQTWYMYENGIKYILDYKESQIGQDTKLARDVLYGFAAAMITHTVVSLGLLFAALTNYLITLEKRDFIPIIEYYHNLEGEQGINLGMKIKLK